MSAGLFIFIQEALDVVGLGLDLEIGDDFGIGSVEAVSDEEDDGELYDDETDQEEEMLLTTFSRQSTMEETSMQYNNLSQMQ
ncbi:hypothetical protein PsorP6_006657 [Peronosclerospora sorghi]|uniref:Uncharacterized protein n=1 Tax=Peronosclerospora sorghi TaxID=230839 RepID=A0ACC0W4T5_9STRA|nr:hypothetical protein PsorP6_006657 [Peronosclerospora sorghi]